MLLKDLLNKNLRKHPYKTAFMFGERKLTFAQFNQRVNRLVNGLLEMGVRKADRIAILADDCPEYAEAYWVAAKGGMVIIPVNRTLRGRELAHVINNSEARVLFASDNYRGVLEEVKSQISGVERLIVLGKEYEELLSSSSPEQPQVEIDEEDIYCIGYTGGTTGLPKGVILTHRNLMAAARDMVILYRLEEKDIVLNLFPYHSIAVPWNMSPCFYIGCTYAGLPSFDIRAVLETIARERVTVVFFAAPMLQSILEYPELQKYDLSSLRLIHYSATPIPRETVRKALQVFGPKLFQLYGLTECLMLTRLASEEHVVEGPPETVKRLGSCGREVLNAEVRVVDDEDRDVPPGVLGEIIGRAEYMMKGYWKMPEVTAEALRGGFVHTGDMGMFDEDGYLFLGDRKKDMITVGKKVVIPREIEEVLYRHPAVLEATAIGFPDEKLGEVVKAVVVLREGRETTAKEIMDFCRRDLPDYAVPCSVVFIDKLPRSPLHKVLRRVLREKYGG